MTKKLFLTMTLLATAATMFVSCNKNEIDDEPVPDNVVDLGLPSGNLWATCNVGADNPWNYGDYYAWGETTPKTDYSWETYKYCNGTDSSLTKYNNDADYGTVDNKNVLEPTDDAATAVLGAEYSMPTFADWKELADECYWVWTSNYNNHGVSGYMVYRAKSDADKGANVNEGDTQSVSYSLSDAHIFLPATGLLGDRLIGDGFSGSYWSASLYTSYPNSARLLGFSHLNSEGPIAHTCGRCYGLSVRPVKRP